MDDNIDVTRLIIQAKTLRDKIESGSISNDQLCELYRIYAILIQFHQLANPGH